MNMNLFEKILTVFKYMFSSFLSIELFILCLLLFLLLVFNLKYKNKYVNIILVVVYISFIGMILVTASSYVIYSMDHLIKRIMNYIYFPSTAIYFFIMIFSIFSILYSMFSNSISKFKKVFNYFVFTFMMLFYMQFISICFYNKVDLSDLVSLYSNRTILSIVQISNLLLFGWALFTFFYKIYLFFKKHYDKKN